MIQGNSSAQHPGIVFGGQRKSNEQYPARDEKRGLGLEGTFRKIKGRRL